MGQEHEPPRPPPCDPENTRWPTAQPVPVLLPKGAGGLPQPQRQRASLLGENVGEQSPHGA